MNGIRGPCYCKWVVHHGVGLCVGNGQSRALPLHIHGWEEGGACVQRGELKSRIQKYPEGIHPSGYLNYFIRFLMASICSTELLVI